MSVTNWNPCGESGRDAGRPEDTGTPLAEAWDAERGGTGFNFGHSPLPNASQRRQEEAADGSASDRSCGSGGQKAKVPKEQNAPTTPKQHLR